MEFSKNFYTHLADDFNTPKALASLFDLVRDGNALIDEQKITPEEAGQIRDFLTQANSIFGIIPEKETVQIPEAIEHLARQREKFRKENRWDEADKIRIALEKSGYIIQDCQAGPQIKRK